MKTDRIEIYATIETSRSLATPKGSQPGEPIVVWRWRYRRSNGSILAGPQESYTKRVHCIRMAKLVTGWDFRAFIPIVGPDGEDWSNVK